MRLFTNNFFILYINEYIFFWWAGQPFLMCENIQREKFDRVDEIAVTDNNLFYFVLSAGKLEF